MPKTCSEWLFIGLFLVAVILTMATVIPGMGGRG